MGKRKYEKIEKITNVNNRHVTYIKRTKGLLKKAIELSILCDQEMFLYIYDKERKRVVHYNSNPELNIMDIFNLHNERDFYTDMEYVKVGGEKQAWDTTSHLSDDDIRGCLKTSWTAETVTSQIGNFEAQK